MRKKSIFSRLLPAALVAASLCAPLHAQYENGSLVGAIHDSAGAPIAGADIKITNDATGAVTEIKSNTQGDYEAPSLRVGNYSIAATMSGFAEADARDITVSVGNRQHIDLTLQVGTAQTTVEVSGVALQLETETSERGQNITNYQSEALPLVTRNYSDLLALVPGSRQAPTSVFTSASNSLVRAGSFNVNGERSMFNNFLLDGLDNNAYGESNQGFDNQIIAVPPDSVAQWQVVTNNESAEFGRASGATINVASQAGGNSLHATLYEFIRNTDLNAAGFFKPTLVGSSGISVPFQKPTFNRNQFGFNLGGPILKNKLFYFVDYEGFRQILKTLAVLTLPTQNELTGKLVVPVRNAVTGTIYPLQPNGLTAIPGNAINPLSQAIVNKFESSLCPALLNGGSTACVLPQGGLGSSGLAQDDYSALIPFRDNADKGDLRLDWQMTPSRSGFLRVSDRKENAINYAAIPIPLDGQTNGHIRVLDQQIALGFTQLFGANKIIDARLGLSRTKAGKFNLSIGDTTFSTLGQPGFIPGLPSNPVVAGGLPSIGISGFSGFGRQSTNPQWQDPALMDPKVNFTWVRGNHSLKFGYEYERIWMAVNDNNPLYGSFTYGGGYSNAGGSTVSDTYWADFLFGDTSTYQLANYFVAHLTQNMHSVYAQDDWKVTPQLTLNLGLRWEYGSPYGELYNNVSNFDPTTQTVLTTTPGAVAGGGITPVSLGGTYGKTLVNPDHNDFGPRVGFAYAVDPKTAIRGGFGISYAHYTRAGSGDILAINAPQAQFASVVQAGVPAQGKTLNHCSSPLPAQIIAPGATTPSCYATADQGFPSGLVTSFNPATDNITYIPKNTPDSYVESYFLSIQRQLAKNTVIDIAYVGNHGVHLQGFLNANQRNPALGYARPYANWPSDITAAVNEFSSNFNSLQVKYEQRFLAGLTLLNSFTWEHALDNASASLEGNTPSPQDGNNISADYGQSDYNLPVANVTSLVYELPFGRGRRFMSDANLFTDAFLGGWQVSGIVTAQAGTPFNITYNPTGSQQVSPQISATYRGANEYRPNKVAGQAITQGTSHRAANTGYINYVNPAAFLFPSTTGNPFGNATRNPGRSPMYNDTDLSLNKRFATPVESLKVEFRTELYNVFNHTNFYLPGNISGTQGAVASGGGQITSTFEPRIVQFGLKVIY